MTGAIWAYDSNVSFGGETVFANNMATENGGTSGSGAATGIYLAYTKRRLVGRSWVLSSHLIVLPLNSLDSPPPLEFSPPPLNLAEMGIKTLSHPGGSFFFFKDPPYL